MAHGNRSPRTNDGEARGDAAAKAASPTSSIALNSRLIPTLVILLALAQIVMPYRGWTILLVALGATWLLAYLWARALAQGMALQREQRFGWAQVGDRLEERFTVVNRGWAPALWMEVCDHSTLPGYDASQVTGIGSTAIQRWRKSGVCTQRGLFTLGPTTLRLGDPFGLYTVTYHDPASATLMVTPPILSLPFIHVAPGGRSGDGRPRPYTLERTVISSSAREYAPGDSLSWVHWPISARQGKLFVRLFDGAPVGDWWIILDMAREAQSGEGAHSTTEWAIILAASLADQGLRDGRSVGLVAQGEQPLWMPPRADPEQRLRILRALALLPEGDVALETLLERARPALGRYASVILITADVGGAWVQRLLLMQRQGIVPTVLLLDPLSFGSTQSATSVTTLLSELSIAYHLISRELLDRPEARPGERGTWEWKVLGTGRVIATRKPSNLSWRKLR